MDQTTRLAIALKYAASEDEAPIVIASGRGHVAERMIKAAGQSDVPVHQDTRLAAILADLAAGTEIPPELYQAVAQVLVFVWNLDQSHSGKGEPAHEG